MAKNSNLDVSPEEERFLRRAFRRFAWPYLLLSLVALGLGFASWMNLRTPAASGLAASEAEALIAESASLRDALAAVREEVAARGEQTQGLIRRLDTLDEGLAEAQSATSASPNLESRLEAAHQRINALEARLASNAGSGVETRLGELESRLLELENPPVAPPSWPPARVDPDPAPLP